MEKNLLRMLAAILTCGSMTLTSCVANDDNASGVEEPTLVQLQNDFKDLYIYDISVESPSAFNKVTEIEKSYAPGELISLSTYPVNGKYTVYFKAGKNSSDVKSYRYNSHEFVPLNHLEPTVLRAAFDFVQDK